MSLCRWYISFKAGERAVACVLIRKSDNQIRVPGSTENAHVTFVKNHASSFTFQALRFGRFWSFETYWVFLILTLCCKFTFILILVVVIKLTFVPFQQPRHLWPASVSTVLLKLYFRSFFSSYLRTLQKFSNGLYEDDVYYIELSVVL